MEQAATLDLVHMKAEAARCLAHTRIRRGEVEEGLRLLEEALESQAPVESRVSRLWIGPEQVETLLALGRVEEARRVFEEYAEMVAECQTAYFAGEVERVRRRVRG
jgi:hypothetical protein